MNRSLLAAAGALLALTAATAANATVSYTFDTNNQGWTVGTVADSIPEPDHPASWAAGQLTIADEASETGVYAPGAVLGNQSGAYNGAISFQVSDAFNDGVPYAGLILYGNGIAAAVDLGPPSTDNTALSTYTFNLNESVFTLFTGGNNASGTALTQAEFQGILGNLTGIAFRTEYKTGDDDSRFDNAIFRGFNGGATPGVPEPATWAMLVGGFGLAGAAMRRRRAATAV